MCIKLLYLYIVLVDNNILPHVQILSIDCVQVGILGCGVGGGDDTVYQDLRFRQCTEDIWLILTINIPQGTNEALF